MQEKRVGVDARRGLFSLGLLLTPVRTFLESRSLRHGHSSSSLRPSPYLPLSMVSYLSRERCDTITSSDLVLELPCVAISVHDYILLVD